MVWKLLLFTLLILSAARIDAAEVLWGLFSSESSEIHYGTPGAQLYHYGHSGTAAGNIQPEIGIQYWYTEDMLAAIDGCGPANVGMNGTIWIDALYGDVLIDSYFATCFASGDRLYVENGFFDPYWAPETMYIRDVTIGETIYIAFAGLSGSVETPVPYYGWLELNVEDNGLSLVSSALTYSSGLIVGTGDFSAIPEPSAGVLLLLGLAGLVLRRRPQAAEFLL